jgi:hypothetical protein
MARQGYGPGPAQRGFVGSPPRVVDNLAPLALTKCSNEGCNRLYEPEFLLYSNLVSAARREGRQNVDQAR